MTKYRADVDGLRAIAVLSVVLYHTGVSLFSGGYVGVDVFFVISGFVITRRLIDDAQSGRFSIAEFYVRRVRRIFPALFVTVLLTWCVAYFFYLPDLFEDLSRSTIATALFSSNIYFWRNSGYFDSSALLRPLLHTWSLAVEEQYYIFMPLAVYFVARFGGRRWLLFFVPVLLMSFALSVYATAVAPTANFFLLPTRAWELLLGALLVMLPAHAGPSRGVAEVAGIVALGLIGYAALAFTEDTPFPGANALFPCLGSALLIYVGGNEARPLATRLLGLKPLVWIGLISYSMYLAHWPLVVFSRYIILREFSLLERGALTVASAVLGYCSYRFIEQPFRHPARGTRREWALVVGAGAMVIVGLVGVTGVALRGIPQRFPDFQMHEIAGRDEWKLRTCFLDANQTWRDWDPQACTRTSGKEGNILLWGDSFAAHYVPGMTRHGDELDGNLVQYTAAGCRPILSFFSYSLPNCQDFNAHALDVIRDMKISRVMIAARWSALRARGLDELRDTVQRVAGLGVAVEVIGQSPEFPIDVQTLAYRQLHTPGAERGKWPVVMDAKLDTELRRMVAGVATYTNPFERVCGGSMCPYMTDGKFLYRDFGHFSALGSDFAVSQLFSSGRPAVKAQVDSRSAETR